jgi:hypothetical protein
MKTRLNITIEENLLDKVKAYAAKQNSSVSQLVEDYFKTITKRSRKKSLLDVLDELPKPKVNFPKHFDFKEEYYKQRAKKYGF